MRMLDNKVGVIPIEDPDITPGGIWVPPEAKQRVDQGVVKYRGPNTKFVRVGDLVVFSGYDGTKITIEGEGELIVIRETHIQAIIPDESVQLFPLALILQIIDKCEGELFDRLATAGGKPTNTQLAKVTGRLYRDILKTRFEEWTRSEGFLF